MRIVLSDSPRVLSFREKIYSLQSTVVDYGENDKYYSGYYEYYCTVRSTL